MIQTVAVDFDGVIHQYTSRWTNAPFPTFDELLVKTWNKGGVPPAGASAVPNPELVVGDGSFGEDYRPT